MHTARYTIPDSAPIWVRQWLRDSPTRRSMQVLIYLSVSAALIGVWLSRWNRVTLLTLVFLWYAFWMGAALRWADRHGIFPVKGPSQPPPSAGKAPPSLAGSAMPRRRS